jgi:hypothetical protein
MHGVILSVFDNILVRVMQVKANSQLTRHLVGRTGDKTFFYNPAYESSTLFLVYLKAGEFVNLFFWTWLFGINHTGTE